MYLIPDKLIAAFTKRHNSLDGKLAFLSYYNNHNNVVNINKLEKWRDNTIPMQHFSNEPQSGFVMGDSIQRSISFGSGGDVYIRIYSPQGFEIEISLENFMELATYATIDKKFIIADCVFSWNASGKLYLLSTSSPQYQKSVEYSKKLTMKYETLDSFQDLKQGDIIHYTTPSGVLSEPYFYLGKFKFFKSNKSVNEHLFLSTIKDSQSASFNLGQLVFLKAPKKHKETNIIPYKNPDKKTDRIYSKSNNDYSITTNNTTINLKDFLNTEGESTLKIKNFLKKIENSPIDVDSRQNYYYWNTWWKYDV